MAQPHGRDGLSARRMAVLWTFREPSLCRRVHRALMRNALLDYTPIIPATACHQSNYVETYSRSMIGDNNARDATIKRPSAGPHLAQIQGKRQIYGKRGKGASMCTRKGL